MNKRTTLFLMRPKLLTSWGILHIIFRYTLLNTKTEISDHENIGIDSVSVPIIATFCPFALQVGRTSPWSNDTTDLGKGSIKLQASIVWKGWLKSFSSYRRFYRTKSIGDNKNGQPDYRHHSKRSILRVEFHSNSGPPTQKNSGLLTQKLLAASNGELYTAM